MPASKRPLSPHLQVYRPQITSILSILHRAAGVVLALGLFPLIYWVAALASGPGAYATAQDLLGSIIGRLFLFGWTVADGCVLLSFQQWNQASFLGCRVRF
jgi:succinate dehydrogenase / fumarate reductase cytochrome b subunit